MSRHSALDYFLDLVKIDSPTGHESKVAEYIVKTAKGKVDRIKRDRHGNVYLFMNGKGTPLFLSAHMDTVEPCKGIRPVVKRGVVKSDGTTILGADDKAPIAVMLAMIDELQDRRHKPIDFIFTTSEESGNKGALGVTRSSVLSRKGYCFDSAMPVGTIITAAPYYDRYSIEILGKMAHASRPSEGKNVLIALNKLLSLLKIGKLDEDSMMNIGLIRGGTAINTIPGEAFLTGELRGFDGRLMAKHEQHLKRVCGVISRDGIKVKIRLVRENPGYKSMDKKAKELFLHAERAVRTAGLKVRREMTWGVSDANIFNDKGWMQCINLGYGAEMSHTKMERMRISELERLHQLMLKLVE